MTSGNALKWYYRSQHRQLDKMRKQHDYARVTIHPDTAADLGLVAGQFVWVETPMGRIRQQLFVDDGQMPGVAHTDSHFWYPERRGNNQDGLYAVWESNINAILPDGVGFSDYAGDCYLRGLICRLIPDNTTA